MAERASSLSSLSSSSVLPEPPSLAEPMRMISSKSMGSRSLPLPNQLISLQKPTRKRGPSKIVRQLRSIIRSLPIITLSPHCKVPGSYHQSDLFNGTTKMTGTIFGHRKTRVNLAIQENPSSLPTLVLELAIPTGRLLQDMGTGLLRIVFECEKKPGEKTKIMDEPIWTLYCNGRKSGYGVRREPTDDDLNVMQKLHALSVGAGVLPSSECPEQKEGELTYMRAHFDRVIGSKDSETYHMANPDGKNDGPELSIFFVRI